MKTTTFLMGALAGAAVVMIARRNRMVSAAAGMVGERMKSRWNGMKEDTIGRIVGGRFGSSDKIGHRESSGYSSRSPDRKHSSDNGTGLSQVAHLAAQDSGVKESINEILEQSGEHRI